MNIKQNKSDVSVQYQYPCATLLNIEYSIEVLRDVRWLPHACPNDTIWAHNNNTRIHHLICCICMPRIVSEYFVKLVVIADSWCLQALNKDSVDCILGLLFQEMRGIIQVLV